VTAYRIGIPFKSNFIYFLMRVFLIDVE
jgi:hypothetical protein